MTTKKEVLEALSEMFSSYGYIVTNALQNQERHMRDAAANAQGQYDNVTSAGQDAIGAQDKSLVTTNGLAQMARMFTDSAGKADDAARMWDHLEELLDDLDESW